MKLSPTNLVLGLVLPLACANEPHQAADDGADASTTAGTQGSSSDPTTATTHGVTSIDTSPRYDIEFADDVGLGGQDCRCDNEFSYVWIANSTEGTVSKINTRTGIEEGRYLTRADGAGNPSRTSVSVDGSAAAVANRHGGVVKIWSRPEFLRGSQRHPRNPNVGG